MQRHVTNIKNLLIGIAFAVFSLVPPVSAAVNYGSGNYGQCEVQRACAVLPPANPGDPPVIVQNPPAAPQNPAYKLTPVGIVDGSNITVSPVTLGATVEATDQASGQPATSTVGWVRFFVESLMVGTSYDPAEDGIYSVSWDAKRYAGENIAIVAYDDSTGEPLARTDFRVTVDIPNATLAPTSVPEEEPKSWIENFVPTEVAENITKTLKELPPVVVYTFPYWLFVVLALIAGRVTWHAIREAGAAERMRILLSRQQHIAEEKDNFITLASHYLHTPLTVMQNGADTMIAAKEVDESAMQELLSALEKLKLRIDNILDTVESNDAIKNIQLPGGNRPPDSALKTFSFWLPVLIVFVIVIVMNLLLGTVGGWQLGVSNLLLQGLALVAVVVFLFMSLRTRSLRQHEKEQAEQLVAHQNAVDDARNNFIDDVAVALQNGLIYVDAARQKLPETPMSKYVKEGYDRFVAILARFQLLKLIRAGRKNASIQTFDLQGVVDAIIAKHQPQIELKKLAVEADMHGLQVTGDHQLLPFVIGTLIDNAIKFSKENGRVVVSASKKEASIQMTVTDNGIGIPSDKLPQLFKPFSRAGSAVQFDYEGLGFSLFLDRIIMTYLNGDIDIASKPDQGTLVRVLNQAS